MSRASARPAPAAASPLVGELLLRDRPFCQSRGCVRSAKVARRRDGQPIGEGAIDPDAVGVWCNSHDPERI